MKRPLVVLLLAVSLTGCATVENFQSGLVRRFSSEKKLGAALRELKTGNMATATSELESIVAGPGVDGVTDEALFRLSLLILRNNIEREPAPTSQQLLERLKREYPESPWTRQAQPLADHLASYEELKKTSRNLKILNLSLSKDNKELQGLKSINQSLQKENRELHQNIERLKNLDIELERKSR